MSLPRHLINNLIAFGDNLGTVRFYFLEHSMANFTQRDNGNWQAKIRRTGWPDQSKTFQTLEAAQQWARATEREMDIGAFINRNDAEKQPSPLPLTATRLKYYQANVARTVMSTKLIS